jgi:hypothetical protein
MHSTNHAKFHLNLAESPPAFGSRVKLVKSTFLQQLCLERMGYIPEDPHDAILHYSVTHTSVCSVA